MIRFGKIVNRVTLAISMVSYAGVLAIMLLNVADVLLTKAVTKPVTGAYEITEVLLLCTVMASFAYGQSKKTHINMTLFIKYLPSGSKFIVYGLMGLLSAATAGAVGYAAILQAQSAMDKGAVTSVLLIPLYPFYYVEAVAMFVFAVVLLYDALLALGAVWNERWREIVASDWSEVTKSE